MLTYDDGTPQCARSPSSQTKPPAAGVPYPPSQVTRNVADRDAPRPETFIWCGLHFKVRHAPFVGPEGAPRDASTAHGHGTGWRQTPVGAATEASAGRGRQSPSSRTGTKTCRSVLQPDRGSGDAGFCGIQLRRGRLGRGGARCRAPRVGRGSKRTRRRH